MNSLETIMLVDDEPNVLSGFNRSLGREYKMALCHSGAEALDALRNGAKPSVIITDMRMPEMNGIELVQHAREISRDSVFVMLTGNADQQTAIDAINQGQVFRFLTKPCDPDFMRSTIKSALDQHRLITAERVLLRDTVSGCVRLLMEAAVVSDPEVERLTQGVRRIVRQLCEKLVQETPWAVSMSSSLFAIGLIACPRSGPALHLDDQMLDTIAKSGGRLLQHIPRMSVVSQIIGGQREPRELPQQLNLLDDAHIVSLGACLLRFSIDWHRACQNSTADDPFELVQFAQCEHPHDERIINAAQSIEPPANVDQACSTPNTPQLVSINDLQVGDVLNERVITQEGVLVLPDQRELSAFMIERLRNYDRAGMLHSDTIEIIRTSPVQLKIAG